MKKTNKIAVSALTCMITFAPVVSGIEPIHVSAVATKSATTVTTTTAEKAVKTLETNGKKLNTNYLKVKKTYAAVDSSLLSKTTSAYTAATKQVNALKSTTTKTKLQNRIATQKKVIDNVNKYKDTLKATEADVTALATLGTQLTTHLTTIYPTLGKLDTTLVSKVTKSYTATNKKVTALPTGTLKTSLAKKVKAQKTIIDNAGKYKSAKSAATRINEAKAEFNDSFDESDTNYLIELLTDFTSVITKEKKYFTAIGGTVGNAFIKKYYDPAKLLIGKYEMEANVALAITDLEDAISEEQSVEVIRRQYAYANMRLNELPKSTFETYLTARLKDVIGVPEKSGYQETVDSLDTGLLIYFHGLKIESAGSNKKYTLRYTTENGSEQALTTGQFKVYFKDGTSKIISESSTIAGEDSVKSELTFESSGSNATRIEYGKGLYATGPLAVYGSLFWSVSSSIEFDDEEELEEDEYDEENEEEDFEYEDIEYEEVGEDEEWLED